MSAKKDAAAIIASASRHRAPPPTSYHDHPAKDLWCEMQWTNLSMQAKILELPELPYFDQDTMLLSKEVNHKLWDQLQRLFDYLGPKKAVKATPVMADKGVVKWHSFLNDDRGEEAEVYNSIVDKFMSGAKGRGEYWKE
ncbi:hypothetical protein PV10_06786 [Exophiala mesophila]|uniref:Uncharacterized protein n=1 Tax=Exophiala mesophila TaxID=212818 RepID=A0A0D1ZEH5_EXOME|nr:uncharacterized protein PV10_06786 [Exophiala mesophila]KIV92334.1 hypothetical protein PV10_06786 [Exophiala mesophila]